MKTLERDAFKAFSDEATSDTKANTRRMQLKLLSWLLSTSSFEFLHFSSFRYVFFFFFLSFGTIEILKKDESTE